MRRSAQGPTDGAAHRKITFGASGNRSDKNQTVVRPIAMGHPFATWRMANDLRPPAELRLDPMLATPGVPLINPELFDARELIVSTFQQ